MEEHHDNDNCNPQTSYWCSDSRLGSTFQNDVHDDHVEEEPLDEGMILPTTENNNHHQVYDEHDYNPTPFPFYRHSHTSHNNDNSTSSNSFASSKLAAMLREYGMRPNQVPGEVPVQARESYDDDGVSDMDDSIRTTTTVSSVHSFSETTLGRMLARQGMQVEDFAVPVKSHSMHNSSPPRHILNARQNKKPQRRKGLPRRLLAQQRAWRERKQQWQRQLYAESTESTWEETHHDEDDDALFDGDALFLSSSRDESLNNTQMLNRMYRHAPYRDSALAMIPADAMLHCSANSASTHRRDNTAHKRSSMDDVEASYDTDIVIVNDNEDEEKFLSEYQHHKTPQQQQQQQRQRCWFYWTLVLVVTLVLLLVLPLTLRQGRRDGTSLADAAVVTGGIITTTVPPPAATTNGPQGAMVTTPEAPATSSSSTTTTLETLPTTEPADIAERNDTTTTSATLPQVTTTLESNADESAVTTPSQPSFTTTATTTPSEETPSLPAFDHQRDPADLLQDDRRHHNWFTATTEGEPIQDVVLHAADDQQHSLDVAVTAPRGQEVSLYLLFQSHHTLASRVLHDSASASSCRATWDAVATSKHLQGVTEETFVVVPIPLRNTQIVACVDDQVVAVGTHLFVESWTEGDEPYELAVVDLHNPEQVYQEVNQPSANRDPHHVYVLVVSAVANPVTMFVGAQQFIQPLLNDIQSNPDDLRHCDATRPDSNAVESGAAWILEQTTTLTTSGVGAEGHFVLWDVNSVSPTVYPPNGFPTWATLVWTCDLVQNEMRLPVGRVLVHGFRS